MAAEEGFVLEKFELEKHLSDWTQRRDSVVVQGTLQDDGDYYVIDRDPTRPETLLRVRKNDAQVTPQTGANQVAGGTSVSTESPSSGECPSRKFP